MEANELRLNNWVYHCNKEVQITIHDLFDIAIFEDDAFTPIPLTEEWLLKFGFINRGFLEDWFIKLNDDTILILQNHLHYYEVSVCNSNMKKTELNKIKYIHQLQNLYFALTGKELILKN